MARHRHKIRQKHRIFPRRCTNQMHLSLGKYLVTTLSKAELENLRMSKNALCELLALFKERNKNHNSYEPEASSAEVGDIPGSKQSKLQNDAWKEMARKKADLIYKKQKAIGCDPSKKAIARMIANEFEQEGIKTVKRKRLNDEYIVRHALDTWKRPEN